MCRKQLLRLLTKLNGWSSGEVFQLFSGLILPDGEINWNCPCLGGMAAGPCGVSFREAFSCFHFSNAEPKGSDCYDDFQKMQDCMQQYPDLYPASSSAKDDGDGDGAQESVGIASSDLQLDDDNAEKECS